MNTAPCPTHPGEILREDSLPSMGLSVAAFARALGVSRQMVHGILAERSAVSPEMALRLGAFFGNGPQLWIDMQTRRDLWLAGQSISGHLPKVYRAPASP
ncbi:MAG: addiction module antidote protein, HigA family [Gammaproteobacteria bacterium RIFOXYD12_FULL_61_37]|nr:MAG: addiction module antidote protein, HigA family [Gammaproteobacteria bacterium RIFOXYD12_FULL_61_37]